VVFDIRSLLTPLGRAFSGALRLGGWAGTPLF
jgi:hypothetical protein